MDRKFILKDQKLTDDEVTNISIEEINKLLYKYKYVEHLTLWFDDEDNPEFNNWIDVEGIGYGWLWCANTIRSKFAFLQRRKVREYSKNTLAEIENSDPFYINRDNKLIIFVPTDGLYYYIITLSDSYIGF